MGVTSRTMMSSRACCRSGFLGSGFGIEGLIASWWFAGRVSSSSVSMLIGSEVAISDILEIEVGAMGVVGLSEGEGSS